MTPSDAALRRLAERISGVAGVVGVVLGGSRGRGEHRPDSDVDLGIYHQPGLDLPALRALAVEVGGPDAALTEPGGWGPWVDGGGWLRMEDTAVDWIYRSWSRVEESWRRAVRGDVGFHVQAGHPAGVTDVAYAGELAVGRILADPSGRLEALQRAARVYPPALRRAFADALWEASFVLDGAAEVVARGDAAYVAGCVFRAVTLCCHALHAAAGRWRINEKGAVAATGRLAEAPRDFTARAQSLLGEVGTTAEQLARTIERARELVEETRAVVSPGRAPRGSS